MNKTVKTLLEIFFDCGISEAEEVITKELECLNEIEGKELKKVSLKVISDWNEYLTVLKTLKNRIEREDL